MVVPRKGDKYLKVKQYYAAWPLHMPGHSYGEWALVHIMRCPDNSDGSITTVDSVVFVRKMTNQEIKRVTKNKLWWGMKMPFEQWALVMGSRSDGSVGVVVTAQSDPIQQVGV